MRLLYPAGPSVATDQPTNQPNNQPPDYSASPDFFVRPIGLFEIWRSAINRPGVAGAVLQTALPLIADLQVSKSPMGPTKKPGEAL